MSTQLKIRVTKDVLYRARLCGTIPNQPISENCAIAVAVRDIFPGAVMSPDTLFLGPFKINLPIKARRFIFDFDRCLIDPSCIEDRMNMPEFEFKVSIPDALIETIDISEIKKMLENHPTLSIIDT